MLSLFFLSLALIASVIYILRNKKSRVADNRYQRKTPVLHAESTAMAESEIAKQLYEKFTEQLRSKGITVETGVFGAMMNISLVNLGPITIILDSKNE